MAYSAGFCSKIQTNSVVIYEQAFDFPDAIKYRAISCNLTVRNVYSDDASILEYV